MTKTPTFPAAIVALLLSAPVLAGGVRYFEGPWEDAVAKARDEDKHVFVQGTAVWCGPCIVMEKEVLPLDEVGAFFDEHFVYVRWDYDDESEAMKALREKYDFNSDESHALPGYMVIDADGGDVVYRADSYMEPEVFLMMGRIALGHAETSIESLERFRSGERDVGFLNEFLGKFPLLFLADHFPADEQHRLVPVLLEAADSYLRQSCSPAGTIVWRPSVWTFW